MESDLNVSVEGDSTVIILLFAMWHDKIETMVMVTEVGRNIDANNEQKELYSVVDLSDCRVKKVAWNRKVFLIQWHMYVRTAVRSTI